MSSKTNFYDIFDLPDPQIYSHGAVTLPSPQLIFTSGQLGQRRDGSFPESRKDQIDLAFHNLAQVIRAGGADVRDIVKITFLVVDYRHDDAMDFVEGLMSLLRTNYGLTARPTTTLIPVPNLADPRACFEVEAIAALSTAPSVWTDKANKIDRTPASLQTDVVVIGAGFAGLQAAHDIHLSGLTCIVLEATDRIGGRSYTTKLKTSEGSIELGATWINELTQPTAYGLTQRFGLECRQQYQTGAIVWQDANGAIWRNEQGKLPQPPNADHEDDSQEGLLQMLEDLQSRINIADPGKFGDANDMTVEEWIQSSKLRQWPADFMRHLTSSLVGREAREVGLHYIADYIKSGGGFMSLASEGKWGAQSLKIKQGTSAIAAGLTESLPAGAVLLNNAVSYVDHFHNRCTVGTINGTIIECSRVVFAIPTNEYTNIKITPPLPPLKRAMASRTKPGNYDKIIVTYDTPWWKDLGLVGSFWSIKGPINFSWELSDEENRSYHLALFIAGDGATAWESLTDLAKEEALLVHLTEMVGQEHADKVRGVREINMMPWSGVKWFGGAPTSSMGAGELSRYGAALREPYGKLYFGGAETAYEWKGYLEGALRSGSRVAEEVIADLKAKTS